MGCEIGFRHRGIPPGGRLPESVREEFWAALRSGLSPTAAATVAGVSAKTGRLWAKDGGYQTDPKHYGIRYPQATREAFWEAVRSGLTPPQAAVIAGVSEHTGRRWVQQAGYVPRTPVPADVEPDPSPPKGADVMGRALPVGGTAGDRALTGAGRDDVGAPPGHH